MHPAIVVAFFAASLGKSITLTNNRLSIALVFSGGAIAKDATCPVASALTSAQAQIIVDKHNELRKAEPAKNMAKLVSTNHFQSYFGLSIAQ
jgi:hypothetical protein